MLISNSEHNFLCSEASCMFQAFKRYAMRKVQVIEKLFVIVTRKMRFSNIFKCLFKKL